MNSGNESWLGAKHAVAKFARLDGTRLTPPSIYIICPPPDIPFSYLVSASLGVEKRVKTLDADPRDAVRTTHHGEVIR
jgi:hypothetical protein